MSTQKNIFDLLIIGGGVNGCGIARDAAGRGLSVYLCEKSDIAKETSSRSSKMIHGGLRYLEYNEFRLVREALAERDVLLTIAPHLVEPLQLIIPHNKLQRSTWLIRLGLFLYDHLGVRFFHRSHIPKSYGLSAKKHASYFAVLKKSMTYAFCYYDCTVDDARLVLVNALDAHNRGATIALRTEFLSAKRENGVWQCQLKNSDTHESIQIQAKAIVNAAGPWVSQVIHERLNIPTESQTALVKGSHIVVKKLYEGSHAYLLQHPDKRVIFVIPYHNDFTMIGTTDVEYHGDPAAVSISEEERLYLCDIVNQYFETRISPQDIVNEWSGVRPLLADESDNPSAVTRDYHLEMEALEGHYPVLSIFGGKITTYRELAHHALLKLSPYFPQMDKTEWTRTASLPGGDIPGGNIKVFIETLSQDYPFLEKSLCIRYAKAYGTLTHILLKEVKTLEDMGKHYGHGLYQKEIDYLREHEWALDAESILWRRTKLGLWGVKIDA
jgi:glycerol-3-phosphate dehydrogenase